VLWIKGNKGKKVVALKYLKGLWTLLVIFSKSFFLASLSENDEMSKNASAEIPIMILIILWNWKGSKGPNAKFKYLASWTRFNY